MSDTLEILKELAVQVRGATEESENTAECVGRIFVGILALMEDSGVPFKPAEGYDTLETLKELATQIRGATGEGENTSERVGRVFAGILNLLKRSGIESEIVEGGDSIEVLQTLSGQIRGATLKGENTAERVGRLFVGILNLLAGDRLVITVGINPNDVDRVTVTGEGADVTETTVSAAKDSYTIKVRKGGTATVKIVAADGYVVSQVNVDKVSQGKIDSYTFDDVSSDHTMYVWMAEDIEEQTDHNFLTRSDLTDVTYSGIGECMEAIKADYPNGLTKDVTITCISKATEIRGSQYNSKYGIFVYSSKNPWNQGSIYTLTIDGGNLYTINCKWLGGIYFNSVDNVIIKNLSVKNYYNMLGKYSPEEMAAVIFGKSNKGDKCRNIVLYNCTFNGHCTNSSGNRVYAWACVNLKSVVNTVVRKCTFEDAGSVVLRIRGCSSAEITGNSIQGDYHTDPSSSLIAHPVIISAGGSDGIIKICDNDLNGSSMREYAVSLSGFKQIDIHRNIIHDCPGQFFSIGSSDNLSIMCNVVYNNITNGLYSYTRRIFGCGSVGRLEFKNNTIYMNGKFSANQEVASVGKVVNLINCNNIVMNPLNNCYIEFNVSNGITGSYTAYNNLYSSKFYDNNPENRWDKFKPLVCVNNDPEGGYLNMSFTEQNRLLSAFQANGYETGSRALSETAVLLNIQNGGNDYKLIDNLADTCQAYIAELPEFDYDYKKHGDAATIGAYNLQGTVWDESTDTSTGYMGMNTADQETFTDVAVYQVPTDDIIVLQLNCKNRDVLLKTTLTPDTGEQSISFGQIASLAPVCVSQDEMYVRDNNYNMVIEQLSYE